MAVAPKHLRVLLPSNYSQDHDVEEIGGSVVANLYGPAKINFPPLPVDQQTLQTGLTDFTAAIAATVQGGRHATNEKNKKKHDLVKLLRLLGLYVQAHCNDDVAILTSSGFQAASQTRVRGPLEKANIIAVENGHSGQLLLTADQIQKAVAFEVWIASVSSTNVIGEWKYARAFTFARQMPIDDLTAGANYAFKIRAIGGTTGYGDYSDPVTHMSL